MKFKAIGGKVNEGLSKIKSVIRGGDALNPFSNVRIDSLGDSGVRLSATDGDIQIEATVFCEVSEQGACSVNGDRLVAFVKSMGDFPIDFVTDKTALVLDSNATLFRISTGNVDDFPEMHRPGVDACCVTVPSITLSEMFRKSAYAASTDKSRALLRGVNLAVDSGVLTMTATDGRRLATVQHEVDGEIGCNVIVSAATAKVVRGLCGTDGDVRIETDGKTVYFRGEFWCVTSKLIADAYPNWRRAMPEPSEVPNVVTIDRGDFIRAIRQSALAAGDNGVVMEFSDNVIQFSGRNSVSAAKSVTVVKYDGPEISIKVNPQFMVEALDCVDEDEVQLCIGENAACGLVRCAVPYQAVVMWIRKGA